MRDKLALAREARVLCFALYHLAIRSVRADGPRFSRALRLFDRAVARAKRRDRAVRVEARP